jgi:hypothetical protein
MSWAMASNHADSSSSHRATRMPSRTRKPTENSMPRSHRASTNSWVDPAESERTRMVTSPVATGS